MQQSSRERTGPRDFKKFVYPTRLQFNLNILFSAKLVLIAGRFSPSVPDVTSSAEGLDLSEPPLTCNPLENYPMTVTYPTGGLMPNGEILLCGGYQSPEGVTLDVCFSNAGLSSSWTPAGTMANRRIGATSAIIDGKLWVTGGRSPSAGELVATEFVDTSGTVTPGPDLPEAMVYACLVQIDASTIFIMHQANTYFFDIPTQAWTPGPTMATSRRDFGCGVMTDSDGSLFVVAAGGYPTGSTLTDTTEFLSLRDPAALAWVAGKKLKLHTDII